MSDTTNDNKPTDLMGYEDQIEHAPETSLPDTSNATDVQSIINKAVKEVTVDDNGKYVYPENIDPMLKAAVAATKSYRDNQSGFTKSQQSLKEAEAVVEALQEQIASSTTKPLELSREDQTELDTLYTNDPQAWRARMNMLEKQSNDAVQTKLDEATEVARTKAGGAYELQQRYDHLDTFNSSREVPITPDMMDNDVPPRITNQLAKREITFSEYLDAVAKYIDTDKKVSNTGAETTTTNLNMANGSSSPSKDDKVKQGEIDYSMTTL